MHMMEEERVGLPLVIKILLASATLRLARYARVNSSLKLSKSEVDIYHLPISVCFLLVTIGLIYTINLFSYRLT